MANKKSWIITVVAFVATIIAPVANDALAPMGITITEAELQHLLTTFLVTAGVGAGLSGAKAIGKKKQNIVTAYTNSPTITTSSQDISGNDSNWVVQTETVNTTTPLTTTRGGGGSIFTGSATDPFRTNFERGNYNNNEGVGLQYGTPTLFVKVPKARTYTSGNITKKVGENWNVVQVEQVNGNGTLEFDLRQTDGSPFARGDYKLTVSFDKPNGSGGLYETEFEIR